MKLMKDGEKIVWALIYNERLKFSKECRRSLGMATEQEIEREIEESMEAAEHAGYAIKTLRRAFVIFEDEGYDEEIISMFRQMVKG